MKVPHVLDFFGSAGWISPVERCPAGECRFLKPRETLQRWLQLIAAKLCLNLPAQLHFLTLCSGGAHLPPHQIFQVMWRTITVILCFFKLGGGVGPSFFSRECFQYLIFMLDWNETRFQSSELLCETLLWAASFFGENTSRPDTG